MTWWMPHNFEQKRAFLEKRSAIIQAIRRFFDAHEFAEVQTPVLQVCPVMDAHIHGFKTELLGVDRTHKRDLYLQTSPEFDMKKLIVAGMERIYQICPVFRNAEGSSRHVPEFTMLEWYRAHADYTHIMDDCVLLLRAVAKELGLEYFRCNDHQCDPFEKWERLSVAKAFQVYAKINLEQCIDDFALFKSEAEAIGVRVAETDAWDDVFHAVMAEKIEPFLGMSVPTILYDYPVSMAALSRVKADNPKFSERFELYVCGIELANAFSELTDADEQRRRFDVEMAAKQALYGEQYPADEEFFNALEFGMPESGGIALGVDRLIMLATGFNHIDDVLWAPVPNVEA